MRASRTSLLRALRTFMTIQPVLPSVNKVFARTNKEEGEEENLCYANNRYGHDWKEQEWNEQEHYQEACDSKSELQQITLLDPHKCKYKKEEYTAEINHQVFHNEKIESNSATRRANALRAIRHRRKNKSSSQREPSSSTFTTTTNKNDLMNGNNNILNKRTFQEKEGLHDALDAAVSFGKSAILIHTAHKHSDNSNNNNLSSKLSATSINKEEDLPQTTMEEKEEDNLHAAQLLQCTEDEWNNADKEQKFKWAWATPQGRYALRWFASRQQNNNNNKMKLNNNYTEVKYEINKVQHNDYNNKNGSTDATPAPFIFTLPLSRRRYQLYHNNISKIMNNNYNISERLAREHLHTHSYNNNTNNSNWLNVYNNTITKEGNVQATSINSFIHHNDETEIRLHTQQLTHKVHTALTKRQTHQWRQHVQDMLGLHGSLVYRSDVKTLQEPHDELENVKLYQEEVESAPEQGEMNKMNKKKMEEEQYRETLNAHRTKLTLAQQRLSNRHFARLCNDLHICRSPRRVYVMQRLLPILREHEAKESTLSLKEVSRLAHQFSQQYNKEIQKLRRSNNDSKKTATNTKNENKDKKAKASTQMEEQSANDQSAKDKEKNASEKQSDMDEKNSNIDMNTTQNGKCNNTNIIDAVQEFNEELIESEVNNIHDKLHTFQRHVPLLQRTLQVVMRSSRPETYPHTQPHEEEQEEHHNKI